MSVPRRLALIALGYALAVVVGFAAVAVNELFMPADIAQTSPGMVAFGDMILLVLVAGFFGLVPTWFLLKLAVQKAPGVLLAALLLAAAPGPISWMAVARLAGGPASDLPRAVNPWLGVLLAFAAIPRIVAGPILVGIEALAIFLVRQGVARALLVAAMLMDVIPLGLYVMHMARAIAR